MSVEIISLSDNILTLKISGKLSESDLSAAQSSATTLIQQNGEVWLPVLAEDFPGWENKGDWGDLLFQAENDQRIAKLAMVGEKSRGSCHCCSRPRACAFPIE